MIQPEFIQLDESKMLVLPGNSQDCINYATQDIIKKGQEAIKKRGLFTIALSGGSTPKKIYQLLKSEKYKNQLDYTKVFVFFGDERSASPDDPDSNFKMAMDNGFNDLAIPKSQIFRMKAESNIENGALEYEKTLQKFVPDQRLDFIMLGMGDDGHTASLFPKTQALKEKLKFVVANQVPQKQTVRMTMTFNYINRARNICFYVIGAAKKERLKSVLLSDQDYPCKHIGTKESLAHWIVDTDARGDITCVIENKKEVI